MTLTAKGQATRQRIIEGAAEYLRSDDPGEATLDDIRAITGTSKGQIFHYFPAGKDELLLAVARHESARVLDDQQPHLGSLTSWAAWTRWRDAVVARYRAQGRNCPLGMLMTQIGSTPGAAEVVATLLEQWYFAQPGAPGTSRPRSTPSSTICAANNWTRGSKNGLLALLS
jgi:AcrR family transcriptional regulator